MTGSAWREGVDHAAHLAYTRPYTLESDESWRRCMAALTADEPIPPPERIA